MELGRLSPVLVATLVVSGLLHLSALHWLAVRPGGGLGLGGGPVWITPEPRAPRAAGRGARRPRPAPARTPTPASYGAPAPAPPAPDGAPASGVAGGGVGALSLAEALAAGNVPPAYPEEARSRGWQGVVWLELAVGEGGLVDKVEVFRSSGHALLDEAASEAVARWRLAGIRGARRIPIRFRLD